MGQPDPFFSHEFLLRKATQNRLIDSDSMELNTYKRRKRIAFVHNKLMSYRIQFFIALSNYYDIDFIFICDNGKDLPQFDFTQFDPKANFLFDVNPFSLFHILLAGNYDLVICGSWDSLREISALIQCLIVSYVKKIPFIIWSESWNYNPKTIMARRRIADPIIHYLLTHSNALVGPGSKTKELFLHYGISSSKIFIAPNAHHLEHKRTTRRYENLEKEFSTKKKILYLSRVVNYKGLDVLIEAFAILEKERKDVALIVGGDGDFLDYCKDLSLKLGVNSCFFLGYVSEETKPELFQICDIFVLPSCFRDGICEAWGLVLNEAMYFGKPIIATDAVGGAYDLIINGLNGYMIKNSDKLGLADALRGLINNPDQIKSFGENSKHILSERYSVEEMVGGFKSAIEFSLEQANSR